MPRPSGSRQEAIHEAIHYSQKSLDELYGYLSTDNSAVTPSPAWPGSRGWEMAGSQRLRPESIRLRQKGKKGCPKCNVIYTPTSSYCQQQLGTYDAALNPTQFMEILTSE